jgi:putative hydrolase of the HAD superfamily
VKPRADRANCTDRERWLPFDHMPSSQGLSLIFDADDTLWDSNIHFLEAEAEFVTTLAQAGVDADRAEIHAAVRRCELDIIRSHGYGRRPYVMALHRVTCELAPPHLRERLAPVVEQIGEKLTTRECELLPGVMPTVEDLATRHRLMLLTKGAHHEQTAKLERSGLGPFFARVEVVQEKDVATYRRLVAEERLKPETTFMIGNSPRSDINPAVRAGLRAVYIAHPHTWELEHEEIDFADGRVISLPNFPSLLRLF